MRQIQFNHERLHNSNGLAAKGGRTTVMQKITKAEFDAVIPSLTQVAFILEVGVAVCSKKENYDKSIGRALAKSRMKPYHLFVTAKTSDSLQLYNAELGMTLFLKKSDFTDDINFVDVV